ncbi:MAG: Zn-dependent hydrolase [Bacteroidales bacterium]|nr:Zn-dependent hydrolase [Bacteroidales bacterium]
MKLRSLFPAIIAGFFLVFQGCNEKEAMYDLFAGTLPIFEIADGEAFSYTSPRSIFLRLMDDAVELEGEMYTIERTSEDDQQVAFLTSFPLERDVTVTGMIFRKSDQTLVLEIGSLGKSIILELFDSMMERKTNEYVEVDLTADISALSDKQKELLRLLFQVAEIMEDIYWDQVFPDREAALSSMVNEYVIRFFKINYGPWERLNGNLPYLSDYGQKPAGSGYYPPDMTLEEFESLDDDTKTSLYTLITRNSEGNLQVVPYHVAYADQVEKAASLIKKAADLAEDEGFKKYLQLRAEALLTDDYYPSDMAWMDMKDNVIDFVVGPIENYEDALFNYKAAHESFILIKDKAWSEKLSYINSVLPQMQNSLPVSDDYKREIPGKNSDLGAYDVVYYAGDCNAGSKTIAINLPNDVRVHANKGSRKLQLKNAIRYKFEKILVPISNILIAEEQREHVTFDAFFENIMYHEVAHGLGIKQTIDGSGTVRFSLKEQYSALEEGKADILSLYLITQMKEMGMMEEKDLMDNYVTFMASIFRSIRFGAASSHGKANMIRFYYFQEMGAFSKDPGNGTYRIDFEKMQHAMNSLANLILTTQGDGNYELAKRLVEEKGFIREELQADLDRLKDLSIPVDIVFNQGPEMLGL